MPLTLLEFALAVWLPPYSLERRLQVFENGALRASEGGSDWRKLLNKKFII